VQETRGEREGVRQGAGRARAWARGAGSGARRAALTGARGHLEAKATVLAGRGGGAFPLVQLNVLYRVPSGAAAAVAQGLDALHQDHRLSIHKGLRVRPVLIVHRELRGSSVARVAQQQPAAAAAGAGEREGVRKEGCVPRGAQKPNAHWQGGL
jgi:hypothetical protein